jgi:cell division control protein 7
MDQMLDPEEENARYTVRYPIGEGTFSTVYLAEKRIKGEEGEKMERLAIKHLVPTSSPERIFMEVDCLRIADGKEHVVPLVFCRR